MRQNGARLERAQVRAAGRRGWLTLLRMPAGQPVLEAHLTNESGRQVFASITNAQVKTIDKGGILISGFLDSVSMQPVRQAWWCVPCQGAALPPAPPQHLQPGRRGQPVAHA